MNDQPEEIDEARKAIEKNEDPNCPDCSAEMQRATEDGPEYEDNTFIDKYVCINYDEECGGETMLHAIYRLAEIKRV